MPPEPISVLFSPQTHTRSSGSNASKFDEFRCPPETRLPNPAPKTRPNTGRFVARPAGRLVQLGAALHQTQRQSMRKRVVNGFDSDLFVVWVEGGREGGKASHPSPMFSIQAWSPGTRRRVRSCKCVAVCVCLDPRLAFLRRCGVAIAIGKGRQGGMLCFVVVAVAADGRWDGEDG